MSFKHLYNIYMSLKDFKRYYVIQEHYYVIQAPL